jgi:hypothetical protein
MNKIIFCFLTGIAVFFSAETIRRRTNIVLNWKEIQTWITMSLISKDEKDIENIGGELYDFFQKNISGKEPTLSQYLEYFRAYRSFLLFVLDGSAAAAKTYAKINGQNPLDLGITDDSLIRNFRLLKQKGNSADIYDDNRKFTVKYKMIYKGEDILAANEESDSQYEEILKRELPNQEIDCYKDENFWLMPNVVSGSGNRKPFLYPFGSSRNFLKITPPLRKNLVGRCIGDMDDKYRRVCLRDARKSKNRVENTRFRYDFFCIQNC